MEAYPKGGTHLSILATIINLDEMFATLPKPPIIANHFNVDSEADREEFNRLILTQYGSDFLEIEPSCDCGETKGGDNEGIVCPKCGTEVLLITERRLEPSVWLEVPKGVRAFINPKVFTILSDILTISKFNILVHLVNPKALPPVTKHIAVQKYLRLNIPRGINYFYDHFDEIIHLLVAEKVIRMDPADRAGHMGTTNALLEFIRQYRKDLFCQHLPLPTRLMMITERTVTTTLASSNIFTALDAARTIADADKTPGTNIKLLESKAMRANALMAQYNEECFREFFDSKGGLFRQHVYGTRSHFTFRAVINSLTEPHNYWELHIPWALAVRVFKLHLLSKLINGCKATQQKKFSFIEAITLIEEYTLRYNPLLDALFNELIYEAPGHRIAVLFNRNQSVTVRCSSNAAVVSL